MTRITSNRHERLSSETPTSDQLVSDQQQSDEANQYISNSPAQSTVQPPLGGLQIIHATTGRVRIRATNCNHNSLLDAICQNLRQQDGVTEVFANQQTGSLVVSFDENKLSLPQKIAKIHKRLSDIRLDATHKATSYIAKNHGKIVIEDLNVKGMMANHKLAGAVGDANFYEFRRQLEYKSKMYGSVVIVVDRFFPSTKKCSKCGHKQDMPLKERTFNCGGCGLSLNRDLNAALNLQHEAYPNQFRMRRG